MSLGAMSLGSRCRVVGVRSDSPVSHRLMELGLVAGAELQLVRRAPLGDPLQIRVGDYDLSLRADEAALVEVRRV